MTGGEKFIQRAVVCGVLQGSILGPFLFLVYVNDLVRSMSSDADAVCLYADDSSIINVVGRSIDEGTEKARTLVEAA